MDIRLKNKYIQNLHQRIWLYGGISCVNTLLAELLLGWTLPYIISFLGISEAGGPFLQENKNEMVQIIIMVIVGIAVFLLSFLFLMENLVKYVKEIAKGIQKIADGDLEAQIEVKGNDELSYIAMNLNEMTEKIEQLMEKEREAEKTKNELITNVAHDLRTPLTSIIGYMEFLAIGNKLEEETRQKYIHLVYVKAKRLEKLIEDLFSFTKLNYGKIAMKIGKVDIVMLINQLLEDFYPSFADKNLEYELSTIEDSIIIDADGNLLARLFDNLINNAIKYGAEGKIIRVLIKREEEQVVVKVINYGFIIPKEELNNIFNKFYRVEHSRSENTGGTGLGLAIVQNIVKMHQGKVTAKSSLDGTEFEVRLNIHFDLKEEKLEFMS